jgi:hypothetical protein
VLLKVTDGVAEVEVCPLLNVQFRLTPAVEVLVKLTVSGVQPNESLIVKPGVGLAIVLNVMRKVSCVHPCTLDVTNSYIKESDEFVSVSAGIDVPVEVFRTDDPVPLRILQL